MKYFGQSISRNSTFCYTLHANYKTTVWLFYTNYTSRLELNPESYSIVVLVQLITECLYFVPIWRPRSFWYFHNQKPETNKCFCQQIMQIYCCIMQATVGKCMFNRYACRQHWVIRRRAQIMSSQHHSPEEVNMLFSMGISQTNLLFLQEICFDPLLFRRSTHLKTQPICYFIYYWTEQHQNHHTNVKSMVIIYVTSQRSSVKS